MNRCRWPAPGPCLALLGLVALILTVAAPLSAGGAAGAPGPQPPAPALEYSLYLSWYPRMRPYALAVGPDFSLYVAGEVENRPRPDGAPFTGTDAFVARLSPDGRRVLSLTYLVGSGEDSAYGIAVDARGAAYLVGRTNSADLPTVAAAQPAYAGAPFVRDETRAFEEGDGDAFVARLDPDDRTWRYVTYLGGSASDIGLSIAVTSAGEAAVSGMTSSTDFPLRDPLQPAHGGASDAFIAQFSPKGRLLTSTFLGGAGFDSGSDVARDRDGAIYVAGMHDIEAGEDAGRPWIDAQVPGDVFVVRVRPDGALDYRADLGHGIAEPHVAVDSSRRAYVAVTTAGPQRSPYGEATAQATVMRVAADGRSLDYQVAYGDSNRQRTDIAVAPGGEALVAGTTRSPTFPQLSLPAQNVRGNTDLYLLRLGPSGDLRWGTRLGGSFYDYYAAIASDSRGRAYLAGTYVSPDFPITTDLPGDDGDAVVARLRPAGAPLPIPIGREGFAQLWARSDMPVAMGALGPAPRGWVWGPGPISHGMPYSSVYPSGADFFYQYFDKGAMASIWNYPIRQLEDLASPRLVVGLIDPAPSAAGQREPCDEAVAGDPAAMNPAAVTYRSLRAVAYPVVTARAERREGAIVTATLSPSGATGDDPGLARYGVTLGGYDEQLGHNVPEVFLDFLNRRGRIYHEGRLVEGPILGDWVRLVGLPLSEPYWVRAVVAGVERDVLIQPFERRVLTYTPAHALPWRVEFGNVGRHFMECGEPPIS